MLKLCVTGTAMLLAVLSFGCGSSGPANSGTNTAATNSSNAVKIDPANMPEGLSPNSTPVPNGSATPGIPANLGPLPKGATPTPGIPDAATLKKGVKPGLTPTPGIPSPEELRKQMGMKPTNMNAPASDQMMKKDANKLPRKPQ